MSAPLEAGLDRHTASLPAAVERADATAMAGASSSP